MFNESSFVPPSEIIESPVDAEPNHELLSRIPALTNHIERQLNVTTGRVEAVKRIMENLRLQVDTHLDIENLGGVVTELADVIETQTAKQKRFEKAAAYLGGDKSRENSEECLSVARTWMEDLNDSALGNVQEANVLLDIHLNSRGITTGIGSNEHFAERLRAAGIIDEAYINLVTRDPEAAADSFQSLTHLDAKELTDHSFLCPPESPWRRGLAESVAAKGEFKLLQSEILHS